MVATRSNWHHVLLLCALAVACTVGSFSVRATRLHVVNKNDIGRGDEPYLGSVRFFAQFGEADSTMVAVESSLRTFGKSVREGHSVAIPDEIGAWHMGSVALLSKADVTERGLAPGLSGVIYVAMEQDHGGKSQVRDRLSSLAEELSDLLAEHVEKRPWSEIAVPLALQGIRDGLTQSTGGKCGLLDTRLCRFFRSRLGDDFIGSASLVYVGVEQAYYDELEPKWTSAASLFGVEWPGCESTTSPICPVASRNHVLDFADPSTKGHYRMDLVSVFE